MEEDPTFTFDCSIYGLHRGPATLSQADVAVSCRPDSTLLEVESHGVALVLDNYAILAIADRIRARAVDVTGVPI